MDPHKKYAPGGVPRAYVANGIRIIVVALLERVLTVD